MDALRNSYLYAILTAISGWFSRQWDRSLFVRWLTTQNMDRSSVSAGSRFIAKVREIWCRICEKLRLPKLLQGSIFLHPALFAAGAMVLAPLCPTMVILALVCASFFSLCLRMGVDRQIRLTASPLNCFIALYAVIYFYATLTSTSLSGSLFSGLLTIAFVLFFFVVTSCGLEGKKLDWLMVTLIGAGVAVAAYGFYQYLFPEGFENTWTDTDMFSTISFRVYSTLENPNVLGEYFLLVIPLAFALALNAENWKKRIPFLAAALVMGVCLVLTYSRGCYLGMLFAAAVFLVLLDRRFILVGIIAVALCPLYLPESVLARFTSIGDMTDTSTSYRVCIWMGTFAMLKDYWFCGIGPGTDAFNKVYPEYAYSSITAPHSHNLYLQILCDTGICGIVIFLLLLAAFYRMMFSTIRWETDRKTKHLQIAGVSAVSGFLVQSMTDYTFYNYRVMLLFFCMMGMCVIFARMGHPVREGTK